MSTNINDHDVVTVKQMSDESRISERVILDSLRSDDDGSLRGRNLGGRKGWVTTRRAFSEWIESGNAKAEEQKHGDEEGEVSAV